MNAATKGKLARTRRLGTALVLVLALVLAGQALAGSAPKGGRIKVDGHRLYLVCTGKGSPVVLLEAGLGDWSRGWTPILARASKIGTKVCAYDRLGTGRSDLHAGTRPLSDVVSDLHALVDKAKLRGPFVLGGASIGGIISRYYASLYPKQVAGMVLFDSVPDDWDQYTGLAVFKSNGDDLYISAAAAQLRSADSLGSKPLIVLEAGDESFLKQTTQRPDLLKYWDPAQHKLAKISSNSLFAVAIGSPHWVQSGKPNLSAEAIRLVVASVRSGKALPACSKSKLPKLGGDCG